MGEEKRKSNYRETAAVHADAGGYGVSENIQANSEASKETAAATIVRDQPKIGRNDPCPCGSGKKYKKCCGGGSGIAAVKFEERIRMAKRG